MTGRVFYIDPLHGSSANNGLTSAAYATGGTGPFGSLYDVLWLGDSDPAKFGGSGDVYYLVGSTADVLQASYTGGSFVGALNYLFYTNTRWIDTAAYLSDSPPPMFVGVNTDLEEDGSLYDIQWYVDWTATQSGGIASFFSNRGIGDIWRNVKWTARSNSGNPSDSRLGRMRSYSSGGGGGYFVNCTWDWSNPDGMTDIYNYGLFVTSNPSASFKNCTFLGPPSRAYTCIDAGQQYGQHNFVVGCRFRNWLYPVIHNGTDEPVYGNIFEDCQWGVYADTSLAAGANFPIMNNLFYNIDNDAIYFGEPAGNAATPLIMNNLFVDIGGYALNCASGWTPLEDRKWCFRKNVAQNLTSGLISPNIEASNNGIYVGFTGGGVYGNISDNAIVTGLTLSVDTDFTVTISGFPESALGLGGDHDSGTLSSAGGFFSSGTSGEAGGVVVETEQSRVTS